MRSTMQVDGNNQELLEGDIVRYDTADGDESFAVIYFDDGAFRLLREPFPVLTKSLISELDIIKVLDHHPQGV